MPGSSVVERVRSTVSFRVYALPATQGSVRAFLPKGMRHPVVTHDNKPQLRSWRDAVASEALRTRRAGLFENAVAIELHFHLPRPKTMPARLQTENQRQRWAYPWRGLDLDKLVRACLDALTGVLFLDDAQIVRITASKRYSADPGVEITVEPLA